MEIIGLIIALAICISTLIALIAFTKMCFKISNHIDYLEEVDAIKLRKLQAEEELAKIEKDLNT